MRKIIIGTDNCQRCKMLSMACPDAEMIKLPNDVLLAFAKETNIRYFPCVVIAGEQDELQKVLENAK